MQGVCAREFYFGELADTVVGAGKFEICVGQQARKRLELYSPEAEFASQRNLSFFFLTC